MSNAAVRSFSDVARCVLLLDGISRGKFYSWNFKGRILQFLPVAVISTDSLTINPLSFGKLLQDLVELVLER